MYKFGFFLVETLFYLNYPRVKSAILLLSVISINQLVPKRENIKVEMAVLLWKISIGESLIVRLR
jgi:hypothetical protein